MPFCGSCGAAMNPPAAFCPSCGARSEQTAAAQAVPVPVAPNAAVVKAGSSEKRVVRFGAMGLCAVAILGCAGYWAMNRSGSGGNAQMPGAGAVVGSGTDLTHAPGTIFDVTYTSNTVTVDPATTERTFRGVSPDGQIFVFDNSDEQIKKLEVGSVMLLQGLALKKVTGVETDGDLVVIATQPAALTGAIQNGHIAWDVPIQFGGSSANLRQELPGWFDRENWVVEAAGLEKFGEGGGWKDKVKATPGPGKVHLDLVGKGLIEGPHVHVNPDSNNQNLKLAA